MSSKLYLNQSGFRFLDITAAAGINDSAWSTGASIVDINQDGWLDIYVSAANPNPFQGAPNLLYIHQGVDERGWPSFIESAAIYGLADTGYSTHTAFFDYDLDGDLDAYVLTNSVDEVNSRTVPRSEGPVDDGSARSNDKLYENIGINDQGTTFQFVDRSKEAGIVYEGWGLGLAITDVNDDGWPDIYVSNDFLSNDLFYINQGRSHRDEQVKFLNQIELFLSHQSHNGMGVEIADINNDGLPDILELDMMPDDNVRRKSMFGSINNDSWYYNRGRGYLPQYVRNTLQLNNGNGTFSEIGQLTGLYATDWSWSPLFADLNNDGRRDVIISNGYHRDITDLDFVNYRNQASMFGSEDLKRRKDYEAVQKLTGVKKTNYVFENEGVYRFTDRSSEWGFVQTSYSNGMAYADFDLDGDLDLVFNNINDPAFIYRNNQEHLVSAEQRHYLNVRLLGLKPNRNAIGTKVYVYDHNQEGRKEILYHEHYPYRGYKSTVSPVIHFGLGTTDTVSRILIIWPDGNKEIYFDVPSNQTLVCRQKEGGSVVSDSPIKSSSKPYFRDISKEKSLSYRHLEKVHSDFNVSPLKLTKHSQNGPGVAVGDIDNNGLEDFYLGGSRDYPGTWFRQTEPGIYQQDTFQVDQQYEDMGTLLFDADQDGDLDLYVVSGGNEVLNDSSVYQDRLYINTGQGEFVREAEALPKISASGSCVTACDFDRDGDLDLFVGGRVVPGSYPMPPRSFLLENTGGRFRDVTTVHSPELAYVGMVTSSLWSDADLDGWYDLILVGEWMPIVVFKNHHGVLHRLEIKAFEKSYGWWNSIAAGDFDRDGDMDYVAGNAGMNHRFSASWEHPVCIYAKDFDDNGSIDPVLCHYLEGKIHPYHPRDALIDQIVAMRRRFPLYANYGQATLTDLFSRAELENAYIVKCTWMQSSYIENLGSDQFSLQALPREAQFAPLFGLQVLDVNEDGYPDLFSVGNSHAFDTHLGQIDALGGLLLLGQGQGTFSPVTPVHLGVWLAGDRKSLARMADGLNGLILISTCNQGPLSAIELATQAKNPLLVIPSDINTIFITDQLGEKWMDEIGWGAGYLSQNSRTFPVNDQIKSIVGRYPDGREVMLFQK